eukprot:2668972-Pleurochrysis_carterae.AAC.3
MARQDLLNALSVDCLVLLVGLQYHVDQAAVDGAVVEWRCHQQLHSSLLHQLKFHLQFLQFDSLGLLTAHRCLGGL